MKTNNHFFCLPLTLFILSMLPLISCNANNPVITSIDPRIGQMGEFITLTGSNFGESRPEAFVTIAGIAPTRSSYSLWQDDMIIVRVPELGESGLVHVHVGNRRSNGVLFSNAAIMPRPVDGEDLGLQPRIASVYPQSASVGSLITIQGSNFGVSRENTQSGVFFSWDFDTGQFNPLLIREPEFIEVSEFEMGYEFWSAREIRVRVPAGAVSGNINVRTHHGNSRPLFFEVGGKPGHKTLRNRRIYAINYSVDIRVLEATRPNALYLWVPKPITSPSQRNVTLISRNKEPFIENHRGVILFKLDNLGSGTNHTVNLSFLVEVYSVETGIRPQEVRQIATPLSAAYTQSTELIPSDNPLIITTVNAIVGREQNPYLRARLIYNWILNNIEITETAASLDVLTALEERTANTYTTALLYTAMMRAAGIPCIPLAGVLIDRHGHTARHFWTEFWLDGFGWIPVDPAMGAGATVIEEVLNLRFNLSQDAPSEQDLADFYFGSMDNMRIAFSRGELQLTQMENRGRLVSHAPSFSIQNIWEEATGGLESYSSLWGAITITGIYIN